MTPQCTAPSPHRPVNVLGGGNTIITAAQLATRRQMAGLSRTVVAKQAGTTVAKVARIEMKGGTFAEMQSISDALDVLTGTVASSPTVAAAVNTATAATATVMEQMNGVYLATRRQAAGISRKQLATKSGISEAKIARIELKGGTQAEYDALDQALTDLGAPGVKPKAVPQQTPVTPTPSTYTPPPKRTYPEPHAPTSARVTPQYLRARRDAAKISRTQVSKESGLTVSQVARIEASGGTVTEMRMYNDALDKLGAAGKITNGAPSITITPEAKRAADLIASGDAVKPMNDVATDFLASLRLWTRNAADRVTGAWADRSVNAIVERITHTQFIDGIMSFTANPAAYTGDDVVSRVVRSLMQVFEASPANEQALYRGLRNIDKDLWLRYKRVGHTVDAPVSSWTVNEQTARNFSARLDVEETYNIVFELPAGETRAINLEQFKGQFSGEAEWIAGGRYTIVAAEESTIVTGGNTAHTLRVKLRATDPIKRPGAGTAPRSGTLSVDHLKEVAEKVAEMRRDYDKYGRPHLAALYDLFGVQGLPTRVTAAEAKALVDQGGTRLFRGVQRTTHKTSKQINDDLAFGDRHWAGNGIYGHGTYAAVARSTAVEYAGWGSTSGDVIEMVLKPGTKTLYYRTAKNSRGFNAWFEDIDGKLGEVGGGWDVQDAVRDVRDDISAYALANGYDVIKVAGGNGDCDYYVILNREALAVIR